MLTSKSKSNKTSQRRVWCVRSFLLSKVRKFGKPEVLYDLTPGDSSSLWFRAKGFKRQEAEWLDPHGLSEWVGIGSLQVIEKFSYKARRLCCRTNTGYAIKSALKLHALTHMPMICSNGFPSLANFIKFIKISRKDWTFCTTNCEGPYVVVP